MQNYLLFTAFVVFYAGIWVALSRRYYRLEREREREKEREKMTDTERLDAVEDALLEGEGQREHDPRGRAWLGLKPRKGYSGSGRAQVGRGAPCDGNVASAENLREAIDKAVAQGLLSNRNRKE